MKGLLYPLSSHFHSFIGKCFLPTYPILSLILEVRLQGPNWSALALKWNNVKCVYVHQRKRPTTLMAPVTENRGKMCTTEKMYYPSNEFSGRERKVPQQSLPLDSTTDTFWIKEGCPYSEAYKTFIGPRSMAAGVCVCVWDYQFSLKVE